jgi:hypothetical protein
VGGDGDDVIDVTNDPSTSRGPDNVDRGRGRDIVYADAEDTVTQLRARRDRAHAGEPRRRGRVRARRGCLRRDVAALTE